VFVLAVFGFGAFNLFVGGEPEIASVNGIGITQNDLAIQTERERRRIAGQMGADFDPTLIDPVRLQEAVLEQLIARALLQQAAEDFGVGVSRTQVDRTLIETPAFHVAGQFHPEYYRQTVQAMGYTPQTFVEETSRLLALDQMQAAISETSFLGSAELNLHAGLLAQRRDIAYLLFTVDRYRDQVTVADEEVETHYQEHLREYMTPETVDVAYVTLAQEDMLDDPAIVVSEEQVVEAYEAERALAPAEEERRARHILLELNAERGPDAARQQLEEIRARVEAGASFEEIAAEVSEDPGSAAEGGDLGYAGRGIYMEPFEQALFALDGSGALSEPVQTEFGYHLIQLVDVRVNEYPSLEEARAEIERTLREQQVVALYAERLRELDNLAFEQPQSLEAIESALGLPRQLAEGVTRNDGPGPFAVPEVRERLFGTEVLVNRYNSAAVEYAPGRAVVLRVEERHMPEAIPLDAVADEIRTGIETERARNLAIQAHNDAVSRLNAGEATARVAADHGLN